MQTYAKARLSHQEGRSLWLNLLHEVRLQCLAESSPWGTLVKLASLCALFAVALWVSWSQTSWLLLGPAYVVLALLMAQMAFIGHDAGHGSVSRHAPVNRVFGQFAMTVINGLAFDEWIGRHRAHHRYCQDESRDPDMAVNWVVSLTANASRTKSALGRWLTRTQPFHIWALSLFFGHSQRHLSQAGALARPGTYPFDLAMLAMHFGLWFGVPCGILDLPWQSAVLTYLVPLTLLGPYLAAIFWVNHIGMPLIRKVEEFSFLEHQVLSSRNIINPPQWNWLFGGLNFQIEHHLFPQVPSARLAAVQAIVREHFDRRQIAYHGVSLRSAIGSIAEHLRQVARTA